MGGLLKDAPNSFGPLTPEQEELLRRQAISESWGPMDFVTPMGVGGAALGVAGRALGRGMVRAGDTLSDLMFPTIGAASRMVGFNPNRAVNTGGRVGGALGGLLGAGGGAEYAQQRLMDLNMPPRPKMPTRAPDF
jgi:hypothetical protein